MIVVAVPAFADNYIWMIVDKEAGVFDCVDPGEAKPVVDFMQKNSLGLRSILLTHHHNDHVGGVAELVQSNPNCQVYGPDDPRIGTVTHAVRKDDAIQLGHYCFKILSNPGHTSSHISYYEPHEGWLFCGDTLFSAGCGRVFDGTMEQLHQAMLLFKQLPPKTKVFCAHEYTLQNLKFAAYVEPQNSSIQKYIEQLEQNQPDCTLPSSIEAELKINPFLRTHESLVMDFATAHGARDISSLEVFRTLREQKNMFT